MLQSFGLRFFRLRWVLLKEFSSSHNTLNVMVPLDHRHEILSVSTEYDQAFSDLTEVMVVQFNGEPKWSLTFDISCVQVSSMTIQKRNHVKHILPISTGSFTTSFVTRPWICDSMVENIKSVQIACSCICAGISQQF
jgi:hypothetical protein